MQRVHDVASVMPYQSPAPYIVVRVTRAAIVSDCLVSAGGVFMSNDMRVVQTHAHGAAGTDAVSPVQPQIGFVSGCLETPSGGHRHVPELNSTIASDFTILDMVARATVAVHTPAKLLVTRPGLHGPAAYFAVANVPDA